MTPRRLPALAPPVDDVGGNARRYAAAANARTASAVAASAGKNDSIESSETVTSVAVPKVVTVPMNESSASSARTPQRHRDVVGRRVARGGGPAGRIPAQLLVQRGERGIACRDHLTAEALEEMRAPLREVEDPRGHTLRVEAEAQDVDGPARASRGRRRP